MLQSNIVNVKNNLKDLSPHHFTKETGKKKKKAWDKARERVKKKN